MSRLLKLACRRDAAWRGAFALISLTHRRLSTAPSSATIYDRLKAAGMVEDGRGGDTSAASSSSSSSSKGSANRDARSIASRIELRPRSTASSDGFIDTDRIAPHSSVYVDSENDEYKDAIESVLQSSQFALRHMEDSSKREGLRAAYSDSRSALFHSPESNILNSVEDVAKMLIRQCSKSELAKVAKFLASMNKLATPEKRINKVLRRDLLPPHLNWFAHWLYTRALGLQLGEDAPLPPFPFDSSDATRDSLLKQARDSLAGILEKFYTHINKKEGAELVPAERQELQEKARELSDTLSVTLPLGTLDDLMDMLTRRVDNPQSKLPRPYVLFNQYFHTHPEGLAAFFHFTGIKVSETHKRAEYWKMEEKERATYAMHHETISQQLQHMLNVSGAAARASPSAVLDSAEPTAIEHQRPAFKTRSVLSVRVHCRAVRRFDDEDTVDEDIVDGEARVGGSYDCPEEPINTYMKVFIDNLPVHTTKSDLRSALSRVGRVGKIWLFNEGVPDESHLSRSMRESRWRSAADGQEAFMSGEDGGEGDEPYSARIQDDEASDDFKFAETVASAGVPGARCRNLSKLRVVKSIRSDVCAFFEMEDEEGLNKALSESLRVLGLCVSGDRLCRTKASSLSRKIYVELGTDTTIADLPHSLRRLLGKNFDFDVRNDKYDESSRPMFLEMTFDDHDSAWQMYGSMHKMMAAGVPIKPCWSKTRYFWSMAERAVKSSYAADRDEKVHGFESFSDFSEQMLFDINNRQRM